MLTVLWVAEDWQELTNRIRTDREVVSLSLIHISIFVFDNADNFVIRRDLTSSELAAKSAT